MAKTKGTEVAVSKTGGMVDYQKILADLAARQSKAAASLSSGSTFASFKGGQLVIDGSAMPENKARIIVLSTMQERAYYPDAFDEDNKVPPSCYAYGDLDGGKPIEPHEQAADKQSKNCKDCEWSQFGSAERGRGQACRQVQRIAFIAADGKTEGESTIYQAKIPPTSLKNIKGWLDEIGSRGLSTPQVITELSLHPDPKNQISVRLTAVDAVKPGVLGLVVPRIAVAEKQIQEPYQERENEPRGRKPAKKSAKRKF